MRSNSYLARAIGKRQALNESRSGQLAELEPSISTPVKVLFRHSLTQYASWLVTTWNLQEGKMTAVRSQNLKDQKAQNIWL